MTVNGYTIQNGCIDFWRTTNLLLVLAKSHQISQRMEWGVFEISGYITNNCCSSHRTVLVFGGCDVPVSSVSSAYIIDNNKACCQLFLSCTYSANKALPADAYSARVCRVKPKE